MNKALLTATLLCLLGTAPARADITEPLRHVSDDEITEPLRRDAAPSNAQAAQHAVPVPEPEIITMLLVGVVVLGCTARKSQDKFEA